MLAEHRQLALPFDHAPEYDALDFIPAASNQDALAWLETAWPEGRLALWGSEGCGKSHLLHIWTQQNGGTLLSGQSLRDLDSLPLHGALALDDADTVVNEALLFHVLNTARDRALRLLLSSRTAPSRWPVHLADLSSRLRAITAVEIRPPGDDLLAALLMRLLADRQLAVPIAVQDWLLMRLPRTPAAIREAVIRLDRRSLGSRTGINRALAARILAEDNLTCAAKDEISMLDRPLSPTTPGFL